MQNPKLELLHPTLQRAKSDLDILHPTLQRAKSNLDILHPTLRRAKSKLDFLPSTLEPAKSNLDILHPTLRPAKSNLDFLPSTPQFILPRIRMGRFGHYAALSNIGMALSSFPKTINERTAYGTLVDRFCSCRIFYFLS
jgi:hypothetical protein